MTKTALKYGSISIGLTAVVIALVIVFNLVTAELPAKWVKIDTSTNGLVSFTDNTKEYLKGVNDEIEIFLVVRTGYEDQMICQLLDYYKSENSNISVKYIDPVKNPAFVSEYTEDEITDNSIIVKSDKRSKVVDGGEFYIYETYDVVFGSGSMVKLTKTEWQTYYLDNQSPELYLQQTGMPLPVNEFFNGEGLITGAIDYVITEKLPVLYSVTGHGETAMGANYQMLLDTINVTVKSANLVAGDEVKVPDDAAILFLNNPAKDIFEKELEALKAYVDKGGKIILTTDRDSYSEGKMPNLAKLTAHMGMKGNPQLVSENDKSYYMGDTYTDRAPLDYFLKSKEKLWFIHPPTKKELEGLLTILSRYGEERMLWYVKNRYLKK
jgi:ABC-2 type transport system permease protein